MGGASKRTEIDFLPSCLLWKSQGAGIRLLSADSVSLAPTTAQSWALWVYSSGGLTKTFRDLSGKKVALEFDYTGDKFAVIRVGQAQNSNPTGGASKITNQITPADISTDPGHCKYEITIGQSYTPTNLDHYFAVVIYAYAPTTGLAATLTNIRCYYID